MVSRSGVATKVSAASGSPSSVIDAQHQLVAVEHHGGGAAACGLGLSLSVARTRVAVGSSATSRSTVSTSQSGGR